MDAQKIPATVITGFLGSGKTTLIRNLLATANGKRIALIINEFGDLGVDGDVLAGCGDETCTEDDIVELTNGCICCTVADDFIPTITQLMESDRKPDHIVIETSGLALPQPLVNAFNWPDIRERVSVDGVVTVVDSAAVADGRFADDHDAVQAQREQDESLDHESPLEELFEDQITCADMIILNKTDLLPISALDAVEGEVRDATERRVKLIRAGIDSAPSADVLLGLGVGTEDDIENRKSHHEIHHADGHEHDHDDFESFVAEGGSISDVKALVASLKKVIAAHDVLRLKGFVEVEGKPMRLVVQAVGKRIDTYFDRDWTAEETRGSRLVVIGLHDMDEAAIRADITKALS
ncbi:MAG: cobalamin biosynthesis protein CobW [Rhizobiaceae bacterium]|nr:cobalamin biosynthesis protein CobW [Hyphomicrobiales bacterium]NRB30258.1 cobalamin biosynthesis protein CobW [Rhizobiaceae bacterium]